MMMAISNSNTFRFKIPSSLRSPVLPHFPFSSCSSSSYSGGGTRKNAVRYHRTAFSKPLRCAGGVGEDYEHERMVFPRPDEIPWRKELANSVNLIGIIGAPVQIKHLSSGKAVAWTRIAVKKSSTDTTWISLTLWDELAHTAFQHVEKGQQVHVSGRLVSDTVVVGEEGEDNKPQIYYKVVVQQLNFIERSLPTVSLYNSDPTNSTTTTFSKSTSNTGAGGSIEDLWKAFFCNPSEWWDNRKDKRNPKYPDFKNKETGEALWIEGRYNPPWVKSQLNVLDSRNNSRGVYNGNESSSSMSSMYGDDFGV